MATRARASDLLDMIDREVIVLHDVDGSRRSTGAKGRVVLVEVTSTALVLFNTRKGDRLLIPRRSVESVSRFVA